MRVKVLGVLSITAGGKAVSPPTGRVGALLRRLLVSPGGVVANSDLCGVLWPDIEAHGAERRLQVVVSRLRKLLDELADETGTLEVEHVGDGYRLVATSDAVIDRLEFESIVARALVEQSGALVERALASWEGEPYTGFEWSVEVERERAALLSLRRNVVDAKLNLIDEQDTTPASRRAKFRRPVLDVSGLLDRRRLVDVVPAGIGGVIAVTAPGGYGKSVFLSLWASRQAVPVSWISVDEADNDPTRFWAGVIGALAESGHRDLEALGNGTLPPGSPASLATLSEIIGQSPNPVALVIDDVHLVTNPLVLEQLGAFLAALPASSTVGLASRAPLDFIDAARLPLGAVRRLDADQLRFTLDEIGELVGESAERVWKVTEGWPIAVTALRSAGPNADVDVVVDDLSVDLIDRVLANAPSAVGRLLMRVAHLDRFSVALCEHLAPGDGAPEAISWLSANHLIARAGSSGAWYRLHNLFAPDLHRRADADATIDPVEMRWRIAEWFLQQGLFEDALRHAVASGDRERIAAAAPQVLLEAALRQEFLECTRWLAEIDPDHLASDLRGHSIATCLASLWSRPDVRRRWAESRRRNFGGRADVVLAFCEGTAALHDGRSSEAVAAFERVADEAEVYAAANAPDLGQVLSGLARSKLVEAKMFQDSLRADDEFIAEVVSRMRSIAPAVATYTLPFWSLTAFAQGEYDLAADLAQEYFHARRLHDPGRPATRENSLPGALAAAQHAGNSADLCALAEGIEDLVDWHTRLGMFTNVALTHLIAASLYRASGDHRAASSHQRRATLLMATMPDVPFLARFGTSVDEIVAARTPSGRGLIGQLTQRETELLGWLATDLSLAEIAQALFLNRGTVSNRASSIYRKLGVASRHSAVLKAGIENIERVRPSG